jgi:type IV secretion system protein VirD4
VLNEKDPSWEEAARDLVQGTVIAMLEDSLNPNVGMTKEKFNFYNVFRILGTRDMGDSMFKTVKDYFAGRDRLSAASQLAQTVISNADKTMQNFFGVVTQKLAMFADKGICYMTSGTDIEFETFAKKPTAFFLNIPDQIKVRHTLATLCVAQLYKRLVELANNYGGKLPRITHFILDEFGNMPKFNDFSTIVTVSRSRGVRLNLILQDYKQLETVYGPNDAVTIRNNCNTQILLGANDMDTRKIFSDLMGEMEIEIQSKGTSKSTDKDMKDGKGGSESLNYSKASRPLLPVNEILDLKPGNAYVYCFGLNPIKTKISLFYQVLQSGLVHVYKEPDTFIQSKYFDEPSIFYDVRQRNDIVLNTNKKNDLFDW